jgi:formylglycine-generating enzyme required for sulfatase activity
MNIINTWSIFSCIILCGSILACTENKPPHVPSYLQDTLKNGSLGPKLAIIPTGSGVVGGVNFKTFKNQSPEHNVISKQEFAMGVAEVTFAEYDAFCKSTFINCPDDNGWGRGVQPVIKVSWLDAMVYTEWLSEQTNQVYRLPSEAEWEYAARGGTTTKFWWGDEYIQGIDHCDRDLGNCPKGTELSEPGPAGRFKSNQFGLFDVTSNLLEWVLDCYSPDHSGAEYTMEARLEGDCGEKVLKGSSWLNPQPYVHLSKRMGIGSDYKNRSVGFRVLREMKDSQDSVAQD